MVHRPESWNGVPIPYGEPVEELSATIENGSPGERWASFRALAADRSADSLDLLAEHTKNADLHIRRAAIEAIGLNPGGASLALAVREGLFDGAATVVRTACAAAAELQLIDMRARVLELVESPDPQTQSSALRAIAFLWRPDCFETVFRVFCRRPADEVRKQAGFALHRNADAITWKQLFDVWESDSLPRHRKWACDIAAKFGGIDRLRQLERLNGDDDGHVRTAAARAIEAARNAG